MKITKTIVKNYRTLESIELPFPSFYTAICGRNDSGKTNVIRSLRALMREDDPYGYRYEQNISVKDDYPKWLDQTTPDRTIEIAVEITLSEQNDTGLFEFLRTHLSLSPAASEMQVKLAMRCCTNERDTLVKVTVDGTEFDGLKAQNVLNKLQGTGAVLFYNSTELHPRYMGYGRGFGGLFRQLSGNYAGQVDAVINDVNKKLRRVAKGQQEQFNEVLGRLSTKYKSAVSVPPFDIDWLPFHLALSDGKTDVSLTEWGSGTRNRTLILLTLFRAREISHSKTTAGKVTPILIVEEPESFLHPSAQAEFGRILRDLAAEFQVQVIVTTHSPYFLSMSDPAANILLERRILYHQPKETLRADTSGPNWMLPFGQALGIDNAEFAPWRDVFFSNGKALLLVEGDTDKEYFEMLRGPEHGTQQLVLDGDIFAYGGFGDLTQSGLLKLIKAKFTNAFITFDLDSEDKVQKALSAFDFAVDKHYTALGVDQPGKRKIEGLLPDAVKATVHQANAALVEQLQSNRQEERKSAGNRLKSLYLEEFKKVAKPQTQDFAEFYKVTKKINRALA